MVVTGFCEALVMWYWIAWYSSQEMVIFREIKYQCLRMSLILV